MQPSQDRSRRDGGSAAFLVCEAIAGGHEHVPFNAGFLRIIRTAYPEHRIVFCAEAKHATHVRDQLGAALASTFEWITISLPRRNAPFFRRLPADFHRVRVLLNLVKEDPSFLVCSLTSANASILWSVKALVRTFHREARLQIVLHGDFSKLRLRTSLKNRLNPLYHLGSFRTAVRWATDRRVQHVVLEDSVRNAVVSKYPVLHDRFRTLELPLPGDWDGSAPRSLVAPIRFGFLGRGYEAKGFSSFLELAANISTRFPGLAEFHMIGSVDAQQQSAYATELSFLSTVVEAEALSRPRFLERLEKMHFVCMFYDESYEFTASAVLVDCVEWGKPILGSRRTLFESLEMAFGEIGYLCEENERTHIVEQILQELDAARYQIQVQGMLAIKESRSPEILAQRQSLLIDELLRR